MFQIRKVLEYKSAIKQVWHFSTKLRALFTSFSEKEDL